MPEQFATKEQVAEIHQQLKTTIIQVNAVEGELNRFKLALAIKETERSEQERAEERAKADKETAKVKEEGEKELKLASMMFWFKVQLAVQFVGLAWIIFILSPGLYAFARGVPMPGLNGGGH